MAAAVKDALASIAAAVKPSSGGAAPPKEPSGEELHALRTKYEDAGQEQVFTFYDTLDAGGRGALFQQLSEIDPAHINEITKRALSAPAHGGPEAGALEPLPSSASASLMDSSAEDLAGWYAAGLRLIADNKAAVVLMAGGQGTRLGSSAPKGCFDIGLPSQKSLFHIQAERILKLQALAAAAAGKEPAAVAVPWYVMTSGPTRAPTQAFFEQHGHFGLDPRNVVFFEQGTLPCVSPEGKILLEARGRVAVAPDGNGGLYRALVTSEAREDMRRRGVEHVHAYCVDNCLVRVADPVFLGFAAAKDADIATKVVRKRDAAESVGLILLRGGKPDVVEYSEIDAATAEARDPAHPDLLRFRAANIVNHYYSFRFLASIETWVHRLPHHVARKKIPAADLDSGETVKPDKPNGIKLEQFVFDNFPLLPLARFACLEVRREDEFSPLKNAKGTGQDDPDSSRADILAQGARWVRAAGATVTSQDPAAAGVEVSPLISYGGEGLEFLRGKTITAPAVLEKED